MEEGLQAVPVAVDVGQLLSKSGLGGDAQPLLLEPFPEGGDQRCGSCLACRQALARLDAPDVGFHGIELGNAPQTLGCDFRTVAVEDFLQLAPCMRPAVGHADRVAADPGRARETVVAGIAVELQRAVEAAQEPLRVQPAAVGRVEEDHSGRIVAAPATIVARKGPEVAGFRPAPARVQHRRGGFVHEQLGRSLQMLGQPVDDGAQVERRHADPIGQRATMDGDARPGEDLALAEQGQMVGIFADQHMGDGAFARQSPFNESRGRRRLGDAVCADTTRILGTDDGEHAQLRGHDVEAFRSVLADLVHPPAATRAFQAGGIDDLFDPRQARRQVSAVALRGRDLAARRFVRGGPVIALRFDLGHRRLEIFEGELPVVRAELLGLLAMHDMVQLGDEVLEPLDDLLQIGGFRRQRRVRSQQFRMLAQEVGNDGALVLGQARKVDLGSR